MNEALTKKLLDDFPRLYRNRNESSMQHEFVCGDGWFDLIYKLSQDIEAAARESGLNPDLPEWPLCRQVKEKMGSLRFVVFGIKGFSGVNERISELRLAALNRSLQTCEYCGQPGELFTDSYIATLCLEHARRTLCLEHARRALAMPQTDSDPPRRISNFLDRPEAKGEKSKVFILFYSTQYLKSIDDAIDYLNTEAPIPFLLCEREIEEGMCVEVECIGNPKMVFGFSPPSGNPSDDLREIMDWFNKSKILVTLLS